MLNKTFTGVIIKDPKKGGWAYLIWQDSVAYFGTRKPIKVTGAIDGHAFQTTFLPWGDGTHMLPIKGAILKAINKQPGDEVEVILTNSDGNNATSDNV